MTKYLEIGQIVNTFGIKGMVKIKPFTDDIRRFDELKTAEQKLHEMSKRYESLLTSYWKQYKSSYMKYFLSKEREVLRPFPGRGPGDILFMLTIL